MAFINRFKQIVLILLIFLTATEKINITSVPKLWFSRHHFLFCVFRKKKDMAVLYYGTHYTIQLCASSHLFVHTSVPLFGFMSINVSCVVPYFSTKVVILLELHTDV